MAIITVELPDEDVEAITAHAREAGGRSAAEYAAEVLRADAVWLRRDAKERIAALIQEALDSGPAVETTPEELHEMMMRRLDSAPAARNEERGQSR